MQTKQKVNKAELKKSVTKLRRQFDYILTCTKDKYFFLALAHYVDSIEKSEYLSSIVKSFVMNNREELLKKIDELSKKSLQETEKTFETIITRIKENKIKNEGVQRAIDEYNGLLTGDRQIISGYGNKVTHLIIAVKEILGALQVAGHEDLTTDFIVKDKNNLVIDWKICPTENDLDIALKQFNDQRDTAVWGFWEKCWWAYAIVFKKDEMLKEFREKKDRVNELNFYAMIKDLEPILEEKEKDNRLAPYFEKADFRDFVGQIQVIIENEADDLAFVLEKSETEIKDVPETAEKWYIPESGAGNIKGKAFHLTEGKQKYKLFNELVKKKKLLRNEVIVLLELLADETPNDKYLNTIKINEVIKELRKTTNLDKSELINNGSNITLMAKIKTLSPKITQDNPA